MSATDAGAPENGRENLKELAIEAATFLREVHGIHGTKHSLGIGQTISSFWTEQERQKAEELAHRVRVCMAEIGAGVSGAFLLNDVDRKRMRVNAKTMEAAVRGWSYRYREQYFEEGYGFQPAEEALDYDFSAERLAIQFDRALKDTVALLDFVRPDTDVSVAGNTAVLSAAPADRKNTAFIMTWIDRALDDVVDAVREVSRALVSRPSAQTSSSMKER